MEVIWKNDNSIDAEAVALFDRSERNPEIINIFGQE
jgi:hypothetical protein